MANASELLHFFKQDRDVASLNQDTHDMLAESVQVAFYHLVGCLQHELSTVMVAFLDESTDDLSQEDGHVPNRGRPGIGTVCVLQKFDTTRMGVIVLRSCFQATFCRC